MNDQRVEGATHAQVVSLIRQGGESLKLTVNNLDEFVLDGGKIALSR